MAGTYDHRVWKTGLPVRSAVLKPHAGRLVVGWVTTSESRLLYVFVFVFLRVKRAYTPSERVYIFILDESSSLAPKVTCVSGLLRWLLVCLIHFIPFLSTTWQLPNNAVPIPI